MTKSHLHCFLAKCTVKIHSMYVLIVLLLAATSNGLGCSVCMSNQVVEEMLTSTSMSATNWFPEILSQTKSRLSLRPDVDATISTWSACFPSRHMDSGTRERFPKGVLVVAWITCSNNEVLGLVFSYGCRHHWMSFTLEVPSVIFPGVGSGLHWIMLVEGPMSLANYRVLSFQANYWWLRNSASTSWIRMCLAITARGATARRVDRGIVTKKY